MHLRELKVEGEPTRYFMMPADREVFCNCSATEIPHHPENWRDGKFRHCPIHGHLTNPDFWRI